MAARSGAFDGMLAALDEILAKLRQADAIRPLPDKFFERAEYKHLLVPIAEVQAVEDTIRDAVGRTFGTDSPEAANIARAARWQDITSIDEDSLFSKHLIRLSRLRAAVRMLPQAPGPSMGETVVTTINIHGSVIGSSVAGRAASNQATVTGGLPVDQQALAAALDAMKDLFAGRTLAPDTQEQLAEVTTALKDLEGKKSCDPGIFQRILGRVGGLAEKTLTSTMSSLLTEQVKRIVA